jgi:TRAP-type mannitol/chloroaromatic compound transport system permease small subunit
VVERLIVGTVAAMVGYWAVRQADSAVAIVERTGSNVNTPSPTILKVVLAVAFALIAVQAVAHLIDDLRHRDGS